MYLHLTTRLCRCLLQMRSIAFFQISVSTGSLRLWGFNCKLMAWKFILPIRQLAIENPSVATVASLFWRFGPHICTRQSIRIFRTMSGTPNAIQGTGCQWRWGSPPEPKDDQWWFWRLCVCLCCWSLKNEFLRLGFSCSCRNLCIDQPFEQWCKMSR